VLGQETVSGKSNEITAIPLLLERLALDGALVTIDAIGARPALPRPSSSVAAIICWR
jgi:predicted transposase YbfD/YdcC